MRRYFNERNPDLIPKRGYPGEAIVFRTNKKYRIDGLDDFYRTFKDSPRAHERGIYQQWIRSFPEAHKYLER
jgi:hypothetical protein